ncbi:alcohol oxidase [Fomitiporia mediterranea MF3/22]|uniref:alcohol oxidase n=1 Tax=Fomitiporia mediterranea (strain MF3/22) TaxID=694068 RepID=UPI000440768B|nr:alcohol oxidase [Fomitiporia mediterranea MF3/22]EJD00214.1 alcohol oxidase [Fomitiporia mediterranea MF3/22]
MLRLLPLVAFILWLCVNLSKGRLYFSPSQLPPEKSYDYIVVGGGAGGSVIANRLSEEAFLKVLLIEAGSSDFKNMNIEIPFFAPRLAGSQFDWNFTTINQSSLNNRPIPYPRGFVLGGSTAINIMAYTRGTIDDYDRWANVTGDEGWSWNSLQPYVRKLEKLVPPTDHHNTTGEIDPCIHGHEGPVRISLTGVPEPTDEWVIAASSQLSDEFPFNLDYNSGNTIGISWKQNTIAHGERVSAAKAYIAPALSRPNLDVLVNTHVTRVLQIGTESGAPVFKGVQFSQSSEGVVYGLNASREVILSAGAVKTPHILMLSGIGNAEHLSSFSIKPIVDIPDVGNNLQDHPVVTASFSVNSTNTLDNLTENATFLAQEEALWLKNRSGLLGWVSTNQFGWFRIPVNSSIFDSATDPSAGPTSAHFEFIFTNGFTSFSEPFPASGGHFFTVLVAVVSPTSRGNITLASSNPFDSPVIDPNLLGTAFDIFTVREAIKSARKFVSAPAWQGWILEEYGAFSEAHTDEQIEEFARQTANTIDHVSCTVAMGKTGSSGSGTGALNSDLTVKGTVGLRVVDASAFPFIISGHTQAAVYILAERAADLIKLSLRGECSALTFPSLLALSINFLPQIFLGGDDNAPVKF